MKRLLTIAIACVLLGARRLRRGVGVRHARLRRRADQTTDGTTTTETTVPTATTTSVTHDAAPTSRLPSRPTTTTSSSDWLLIAIEGLIVDRLHRARRPLGRDRPRPLGRRRHADPRLRLRARPGRAAVRRDADHRRGDLRSRRDAGGGRHRLHGRRSRARRCARDRSAINFVAPYVSYLLCILTGTSNTFYSIIPVINEVSYANKIRPERPLGRLDRRLGARASRRARSRRRWRRSCRSSRSTTTTSSTSC